MSYSSPNRGYVLRRLEGNAYDIDSRGKHFIEIGAQMRTTADALRDIANSESMKSKGTDELAEAASETHSDLGKAATRYELAGPVLVTYADALETAQNWIHPRISDIENAEIAYQSAVDAVDDAQRVVNGLDTTWPWEDEPTDADRSRAAGDLSGARSDLSSAKATRDALWSEFETTFGTWSDAYDTAAGNLSEAYDKAGNNDNFWDDVGSFVDFLGWVIVGLALVALFVAGGPLFWVLIGLSALHLLLTLGRYANGNVSLSDVIWSAIGLVSFGATGILAKIASRGAPTLANLVGSGRSVTVSAVRGALPSVRWFAPWRVVTNPARVAYAGWRSGSAPMLVNPINSIRTGSFEAAQSLGYLNRLGGYAAKYPAVEAFVSTSRSAVTPARGFQIAQWGVFGTGTGVGVGSGAGIGIMPKFG
jgi:hypothetical protein